MLATEKIMFLFILYPCLVVVMSLGLVLIGDLYPCLVVVMSLGLVLIGDQAVLVVLPSVFLQSIFSEYCMKNTKPTLYQLSNVFHYAWVGGCTEVLILRAL